MLLLAEQAATSKPSAAMHAIGFKAATSIRMMQLRGARPNKLGWGLHPLSLHHHTHTTGHPLGIWPHLLSNPDLPSPTVISTGFRSLCVVFFEKLRISGGQAELAEKAGVASRPPARSFMRVNYAFFYQCLRPGWNEPKIFLMISMRSPSGT